MSGEGFINEKLIVDLQQNATIVKDITYHHAPKRDKILSGKTIKLSNTKFDNVHSGNVYLTLNFFNDKPYECFVTSSEHSLEHVILMDTMSRMISLALRHGVPMCFIIQQLKRIKGCAINMLPIQIASGLLELVEDTDMSLLEGMKCEHCGSTNLQIVGNCVTCLDSNCGKSSCG